MDIIVYNFGNSYALRGLNDAGHAWLYDNARALSTSISSKEYLMPFKAARALAADAVGDRLVVVSQYEYERHQALERIRLYRTLGHFDMIKIAQKYMRHLREEFC